MAELKSTYLKNHPNLKLYYRFEDTAGTSLTDESTLGTNTGTASRAAILNQTGKYGKAVTLVGSQTDKITIVNDASLRPAGAFSIAAWVKSTTSGVSQTIFQSYSRVPNEAGFRLHITSGNQGYLMIGKNTGTSFGTDFQQVVGGPNIADGNWHHIGAIYSGSYMFLYIDGQLMGQVGWNQNPAYTASNTVLIGAASGDGGSTFTEYFSGSIDELCLFDTALTMDDIQLLYVYGRRQFSQTDTSLWEEGYGDGSDGILDVLSNATYDYDINDVNSPGYGTLTGSAGSTSVQVWDARACWRIKAGDPILIMQVRGTPGSGAIVGCWELNVAGEDYYDVSGYGTHTVKYPLTNNYTYTPDGYSNVAIVQRVPQYSLVNINPAVILSNYAFDGYAGGIVALMCNGSVIIDGELRAGGSGYRGGTRDLYDISYGGNGEGTPRSSWKTNSANGNGGGGGQDIVGNVTAGCGGGGGNQTAGGAGNGGSGNGGAGGYAVAAVTPGLTNMVMGGGGGTGGDMNTVSGWVNGGTGGRGGGIVLIFAKTILGSGTISAWGSWGGNGVRSIDDPCAHESGAGGGGAGGAILLKGQVVNLVGVTLSNGPGGAGTTPNNGRLGGTGGNGFNHIDYGASYTAPLTATPVVTVYADGALMATSSFGKANILRIDNTQANSAKANLVAVATAENSAKYYNPTITQTNEVKYYNPTFKWETSAGANIFAPYVQKRYEYRIYNGNTYITTWVNDVLSEPTFRTIINGGPGEMVIKLVRKFDDFGEDVDIKLNNIVKMYVFDREAPLGMLLYQGVISGYRPVLDGHQEYIEVTVLHQVTQMSNFMLRDVLGNTQLAMNSYDPSTMMKHILNYYQADGGVASYTANGCFSLPGANILDYIIRNPVTTWPTTQISTEFWVKTTTSVAGGIISYAAGAGTNNWLILGANNLQIYAVDIAVSTGVSVNDGNWHHVIVTWNSADGRIIVYKDGQWAYESTGNSTGLSFTAGGSLVIGQDQDSVGGGFDANQAYAGKIDDIRIYSRILSATEASEHYRGIFKSATGLKLHWSLNEGSGDKVYDHSGNKNIGTVAGATPDWITDDFAPTDVASPTIKHTSSVASYTFQVYTVKEALDKAIELTPEDWYWRVEPDNVIQLQPSNMNEADHTFLIGKHISQMETWRRGEDIVNRVYFVGSGDPPMYRVYSNNSSIDAYGLHAVKLVDQRVSLTSTADILANRVLSKKASPEVRTTVTILDNNGFNKNRGYDIESIKVGQTMKIRNIKQGTKTIAQWDRFDWDSDVWDQTLAYTAANVLQIMSVEYGPDSVRIEASSRLPEISKRVEEVYRNTEQSQVAAAPSAPTEG